MGKRKATGQASASDANNVPVTKRAKQEDKPAQAEARKNLLVDSDSSEDESDGGAPVENGFKVNEEFAKRFEYNKKREELSRCMLHVLGRN